MKLRRAKSTWRPIIRALMAAGAFLLLADGIGNSQEDATPTEAEKAPPAADVASTVTLPKKYGPENPRQVRITARLLEWTHDSQLDWGFSVLYLSGDDNSEILRVFDATFPQQSSLDEGLAVFLDNIDTPDGDGSFEAVIQTLEQMGKVEVLSEPNVVVLNKGDLDDSGKQALKPAVVQTKTQVPFETVKPAGNTLAQVTEFRDTAIQLTVDAEDIVEDNYVKMKINTSVTNLSGFISVALNPSGEPMLVPQTDTRSIENTILVRDRSTLIAGVLKTTDRFENEQGVPWLARIPILGYLFKNQQRRKSTQELLFMIRPEIIAN